MKHQLNPFEFYCRTKKENYRVDQEIILFEDIKAKERVTCSFNSKIKKIFERVKVKGNLEFSIRHLDLDKSFEKCAIKRLANASILAFMSINVLSKSKYIADFTLSPNKN